MSFELGFAFWRAMPNAGAHKFCYRSSVRTELWEAVAASIRGIMPVRCAGSNWGWNSFSLTAAIILAQI
jgi:hypothetical protein